MNRGFPRPCCPCWSLLVLAVPPQPQRSRVSWLSSKISHASLKRASARWLSARFRRGRRTSAEEAVLPVARPPHLLQREDVEHRFAGRRGLDRLPDGALVEPRHHRREVGAQVGEGRAAARVGGAVIEELFDRLLGLAGVVEGHPGIHDHDAEQRGAPHVVGVLAQVGLSGAGAVGAAENVEAFVAEPSPHLVEVVRGDGRRGVRSALAASFGSQARSTSMGKRPRT